MKRSLMIALAFSIVSCSDRVEQDDRPTFKLNGSKPFCVELGRGSGWHGLDTIKIDQTGRVILHRMKSERQADVTVQSWEIAALNLWDSIKR